MCIPKKEKRKNQTKQVVSKQEPVVSSKCHRDSVEEISEKTSLEIYDLTAITCDLPIKLTDRDLHWKTYSTPGTAKVTVTTDPNQKDVWDLLKWSEGAPGASENEKLIDLTTARDAKISVTLEQDIPKTLVADLHICQWPVLEVQLIQFNAISVVEDGTPRIDKLLSRRWEKGRAKQNPICYAAGSKIKVDATLNVTTVSTDDEDVKIKAVSTLGGKVFTWEAIAKIQAGKKTVEVKAISCDVALAMGVAIYDAMTLDWSMLGSDGVTWSAIGSTVQTLYVTLGAPVVGTKAYWTLLDVSCRAAAGQLTENTFVPAAFTAFANSTGDGRGMVRKGDGVRLSYYKFGVKTSGDQTEPSVYSTRGILSRPDGTGRCGGWANLLIHLFKIHGISSGKQLLFFRPYDLKPDIYNRFLVKNCTFAGAGTANAKAGYTHKGDTECIKQNGLAGQGKTNPQFDFGDHVVVEHDGKIYDPSYGAGPILSQRAYEDGAIAGIGRITTGIQFTQLDGTKQFISEECAEGFIAHTVTAGETIADIALAYTVASVVQLFDHPYNHHLKTTRVTADKIMVGDTVNIPRDRTTKPILYTRYA